MKHMLKILILFCMAGGAGCASKHLVIATGNSHRLASVIGAVQREGNVIACPVSEALKLTRPLPNATSARIIRKGQFIPVDLKRIGQDGYDPVLEINDVLEVLTPD